MTRVNIRVISQKWLWNHKIGRKSPTRNPEEPKKNEPKSKSLKKRFDAVEMKNQIQADLYSETKHLNGQELIEFHRKKAKAGPFRKRVA